MVNVLSLAGNTVSVEKIHLLLNAISTTPQLQQYSLFKLFFKARGGLTCEGLLSATLWCIGEYGQYFVTSTKLPNSNKVIVVPEEEVISFIQKAQFRASEEIKIFALNTLAKLFAKWEEKSASRAKIIDLIEAQTASPFLEVQKRACDYTQLLSDEWSNAHQEIFKAFNFHHPEEIMGIPIGSTLDWEVPVDYLQENNDSSDSISSKEAFSSKIIKDELAKIVFEPIIKTEPASVVPIFNGGIQRTFDHPFFSLVLTIIPVTTLFSMINY